MEQKNSQELNKKMFSDLIYDPSAITADDSTALGSLVEKYPYSQLLRSFYTRSLIDSNPLDFEKELAKAALFSPDGTVLRAIIEEPATLKSTGARPYLTVPGATGSYPETITETEEAETKARDKETIDFEEPNSREAEEEEPVKEEELTPQESEDILPVGPDSPEEYPQSRHSGETVAEEPSQSELGNILTAEPDDPAADIPPAEEEKSNKEKRDEREHDLAANLIDSLVNEDNTGALKATPEDDELDLLIRQNASADFLKAEDVLNSVIDTTEDVFRPEVDMAENISHNVVIEDQQKVSRYDDDKMPYSFLWWLSKTRKEHTENYQPYVSFQLDTSQSIKRNTVDQLSSQIIENIFHLQSPVDQFENAPKTVPFQVKRKEDYILEKFIREEPQIKPPNSDKLDTDNKARKSAEDPNDLVSETLAQIYTDQMLFHKAIDTYKKLSLKFPEKSPYFADQIRELQKKIN